MNLWIHHPQKIPSWTRKNRKSSRYPANRWQSIADANRQQNNSNTKAVLETEIKEKYATVDMGAINFVIKGADIMSPGIVSADETIKPEETIVVIEENHNKPLAIGISLISGKEMVENTKGKAIENLHFVGDPIWELDM